MDRVSFFSEQVAAGWLLVISGAVFVVGAFLFKGRAIFRWLVGETHIYLL